MGRDMGKYITWKCVEDKSSILVPSEKTNNSMKIHFPLRERET